MLPKNPLDLPEIRTHLGSFLCLDSLCACVLVNKAWQHSFMPSLWSTFYFGPEDWSPTLEPPSSATIHRHGHLIKRLIVRKLTPTFQLYPLFKNTPLTQLKEFQLHVSHENPNLFNVDWIFLQNPGLRFIKYIGYYNEMTSKQIPEMEALLQCPKLVDLRTSYINYMPEHLEPFRQLAATRLERVSFGMDRFSTNDLDGKGGWDAITMPFLKELTLLQGSSLPGLKTILGCPQLRKLKWIAEHPMKKPKIEDIQLIMATCPHLEALELKLVLHDHDIALILDTITSLITELTVPIGSAIFGGASRGSMGFQTLSYEALRRRHFPTLTILNIGRKPEITSSMIMQMLTSCPNLRKIKAYMLAAKDIRNGPGTWVCKGLESFQISISGFRDPLADVVRKAVLRRFAALPRLRVLEIGAENGTIMSLKYGLGQLSGLTQLTRVSIEPTRQSMRREEVEWIRNHWTNLTTLKGCLHDRHEISEAIREVLTARGQGGGGGRRGIERILKAEAVLDQFAFHVVGHRY